MGLFTPPIIVPIVQIQRHELMTPERADLYAQQIKDHNEMMEKEMGQMDNTISINVVGSVVVVMSYGHSDLSEINEMFDSEHENRDAMHLLKGRYIRPPRQQREEDSGILAGID